jgi:hypothetical protein
MYASSPSSSVHSRETFADEESDDVRHHATGPQYVSFPSLRLRLYYKDTDADDAVDSSLSDIILGLEVPVNEYLKRDHEANMTTEDELDLNNTENILSPVVTAGEEG